MASTTDYQTALRSITYEINTLTFSNRTISFVINDGTQNSNVVTRQLKLVPLNNLLSGSETNLLCLNQQNNQLLFPQLSIVGGNALTLESAAITVSDPVAAEDTLEFADLSNGITGNYDSNTGLLTLTGPATASDFEATLRTVKYKNGNDATSTAMKTFTVAVDYAGQSSNALQSQIDLITVNDAPVVINPVEDFNVTVNEPFSIVLNGNTFNRPESELTLSVTENDGALTSLSFDAPTRTLNGSLPTPGENRFSFFASDRCNQTASSNFTVKAFAVPVASPPISEPLVDTNTISTTSPGIDNTGPIVGGVVGGVLALGVIGGVVGGLLYRRNKQQKKEEAGTQAVEDAITTMDNDVDIKDNPLYEKKQTSWHNALYKGISRSFRNLFGGTAKSNVTAPALPVPADETELAEKSISSHEADDITQSSEISKSSIKSTSSSEASSASSRSKFASESKESSAVASSHKSASHSETSPAGSEESEEESAENSASSSVSRNTP